MVNQSRLERRNFIQKTGLGVALLTLGGPAALYSCKGGKEGDGDTTETDSIAVENKPYTGELKISLAQWSHNKEFFAGSLKAIDFAKIANGYGIKAIEYVNQFYKDKAKDKTLLDELNKRAADLGVKQLLIMIDGEGELATPDNTARTQAVENHYKWVEAAKHLGCHSIRVNVFGKGTADEVQAAAVNGLGRLADFAKDYNVNVIVENHGGFSSHGQWLAGIMKQVNKPNCGTLPDFGNFCLKREGGGEWEGACIEEYDKYLGVEELMPYAKAVSAKSHDFDQFGSEKTIDYKRMIDIVKKANYSGYIGIEYEGEVLSAEEGILATKALLEKYI
ncbi:MAG TPA: sugar phosphate isomerase/epimerase family protein [Saprospiraceae bacterium]|nr:sugar phosphate isomerase/epimerase family protein [Saprospiraceae bacterium]